MSSGGIGDFLAMFVHAGDERDIVSVHALVAGHAIGGNRGVGRAEMRGGVHVVYRRGEAVGSLGHDDSLLVGFAREYSSMRGVLSSRADCGAEYSERNAQSAAHDRYRCAACSRDT